MRFECTRPEGPIKWYEINMLPIGGEDWSVVMTYGLKDRQGGDSILQPLRSIFTGDYVQAMDVLANKIENRKAIGYIQIEEEPEQKK